MKLHVQFDVNGRTIDEVVVANSADELLVEAKARVTKELGWKGLFLNAMTPLQFAQLAVKMYNENRGESYAIPQTAEEFIEFGKKTGKVNVLEQ